MSSGRLGERTFEVRVEQIELTSDGSLGGTADTFRRFIPGIPEYFIDGRSVTPEEFEELMLKEDYD